MTGIGGFFCRATDPEALGRWYDERFGIDADVDPETYPNGRFAKLEDPEGNLIQLWEPTPAALERTSDTQG